MVFLRKWVLRLAFFAFYPFPVAEKVVLATKNPRELGGNLKYIADEITRRELRAAVVVLLGSDGRGSFGKLRSLTGAIRAQYHLATSRIFIVDDYFFPLYVAAPKRETTVIQVWHACGAFKKFGYSVLDKSFGASPALVRNVRIHSNYDYCLVGSQDAVPHYAEAFGQPAEKFVSVGIPRTDLFFDTERASHARVAVRERYHLPRDRKVMLYAPTFRGDSAHEAAYHDDLDLALMCAACGEDWILLVKLHPFVKEPLRIDESLAHFAFDVSDYSDINELMLVSDLLITDYSSAIFEYALLERPMVFFAPDYPSYELERGFYFDYETGVPGPVFTETRDVAVHIATGEFDLARVRAFRERTFDHADGRASARFVEQLVVPHLRRSAELT